MSPTSLWRPVHKWFKLFIDAFVLRDKQDKRTSEQFVNKMDTRTTAGEQTMFHRDALASRKRNGT